MSALDTPTLTDPVAGDVGSATPGPAARRVRARRGEGDRLRTEIIDAAERLLVETADAEAVSIRAIGLAVGVTAPSIYRHFPDKDALIVAVCERCFETMHEYEARECEGIEDPLALMHAMGRAYVHFALDNPGQYRVMMMSPQIADPNKSVDGFQAGDNAMHGLEMLIGAVERAIEAGMLLDVDPVRIAVLLWTTVHGMASIRIAKPELPWPPIDDDLDFMFSAFAHGMCRLPVVAPVEGL